MGVATSEGMRIFLLNQLELGKNTYTYFVYPQNNLAKIWLHTRYTKIEKKKKKRILLCSWLPTRTYH
jgi:hypothetical protein